MLMSGEKSELRRVAAICAAKLPSFSLWKRATSSSLRLYAWTSAAFERLSSATAPMEPLRRRSSRAARLILREKCLAASQNRRSEEHTSELQSRQYLVCRILLEKK